MLAAEAIGGDSTCHGRDAFDDLKLDKSGRAHRDRSLGGSG